MPSVDCDYLKLFIASCKNDYKLASHRSFSLCSKTMAPFFYTLTYQIGLDDNVFFTSVELLNKYLICSMMRTSASFGNDINRLRTECQAIKEKYIREKYLIAAGCFQLATQICHRTVETARLIESLQELARIDANMTRTTFNRDYLLEIEVHILMTIDHVFPQYTPHMFISYFLRFLNDELSTLKIVRQRLHNSSMLVLVHIYLQWTSLIELLAKKESGLAIASKVQMDSVIQRLRDPLLLGSATILAASKMFCHAVNSQMHDKIISLFVSLLGIDPMRIYMAQFFADEVLHKSINPRPTDSSISRILVDREHDFDDESFVTFSSH